MKFRKLVAIEPVSLIPSAEKELLTLAEEVVMYNDIPSSDEEIASRVTRSSSSAASPHAAPTAVPMRRFRPTLRILFA